MARLIDVDEVTRRVHLACGETVSGKTVSIDWLFCLLDELSVSPVLEKQDKMLAELQYQYDKETSENKQLKECIVRMALGRYGVLND